MSRLAGHDRTKAAILAAVRAVATGRVATHEAIAACAGADPRTVAFVLSKLSEDERQMVPWHRVVAKGGAVGWGPHRDQQFARLVREGVQVSPAGIVQDFERAAIRAFDTDGSGALRAKPVEVAHPVQRSRGMKDRP